MIYGNKFCNISTFTLKVVCVLFCFVFSLSYYTKKLYTVQFLLKSFWVFSGESLKPEQIVLFLFAFCRNEIDFKLWFKEQQSQAVSKFCWKAEFSFTTRKSQPLSLKYLFPEIPWFSVQNFCVGRDLVNNWISLEFDLFWKLKRQNYHILSVIYDIKIKMAEFYSPLRVIFLLVFFSFLKF